MKFENALKSAMAQEIIESIAIGSASTPKLQIYNGAVPAAIGDAIAGTLLAEFDIDNAVGSVANGVLTFSAIIDDPSANATGDPTWGRIIDRDGATKIHMTASAQGGSGEIQVNPGTITAGQPVSVSLGVIRVGQ